MSHTHKLPEFGFQLGTYRTSVSWDFVT